VVVLGSVLGRRRVRGRSWTGKGKMVSPVTTEFYFGAEIIVLLNHDLARKNKIHFFMSIHRRGLPIV